jgi:ABC-type glycerol-3-phosphate transport system permease component
MATGIRGRGRRLAFYFAAASMVVLTLAPILWVFKMSILPARELFASPPSLLPDDVTSSSYRTVLSDPTFLRGFLNSAVIAGLATLACLIAGAPAAYALTRLRFPLRTLILTGVLALAFFPAVAVIAPLFIEFRAAGLLNTYLPVVLTDTVFALPLAVWILSAFFRQLPRDLEDAAKVDGARTLQAFRLVIVPLAAPGMATTAIVTFIVVWNEFLFANTFLFDERLWPATVVIPSFAQRHSVAYGPQAAAALLVTLPLAVVALAFQRRIVQGLTAGAVKG